MWTGYALNVAIGLQVLLGALTTGLAAAVTSGRQASFISMPFRKTRYAKVEQKIGASFNRDFGSVRSGSKAARVLSFVIGGLATLVASYLARARGSGEPELSITRVKDLEQFLRECRAFQLDHAHEYGTPENGLDFRLAELRRRFEELLGNANGYAVVFRISPSLLSTCFG